MRCFGMKTYRKAKTIRPDKNPNNTTEAPSLKATLSEKDWRMVVKIIML